MNKKQVVIFSASVAITSVFGSSFDLSSLQAEPLSRVDSKSEAIALENIEHIRLRYSLRAEDLRQNLQSSLQITQSDTSKPSNSVTPSLISETPPVESAKPQEWTIDSTQTDFSYQHDNFGLTIYSVEPSVSFRYDANNKFNLKSGFINLNGQTGFKPVTIYPIRLGWEGRAGQAAIKTGATVYTFDRLAPAFGFDASVNIPILPNLNLGASIERTPMKFAPSTLEIPSITTYTAYGPNIYWQIDQDSSLFSFLSILNLNDSNRGFISYSKLKRNFGQFSIAANLVTTSYDRDAAPNYFAPSDYLIYNGEIGWQGDLNDFLNLRAQINLGEQRLRGEYTRALYYETQLTAKLSSKIDAFINYSFGDLDQISYFRATGQNSLYSRYLITGQLKFRF